jgi:hypothetical protein
MLYLHCGWPRTGTSSFQEALSSRAEELANAGITYPASWRRRGQNQLGSAHHGLTDLLGAGEDEAELLTRFQDDLRSWHGDVLLSSEAISNWVVPWLSHALVRMLDAARAVTELTMLWTLRRMDDFLASMYLHQVLLGRAGSPEEFYEHRFSVGWIEGFIEGSAEIDGLPELESVYTKYDRGGAYCADLLKGIGVGWRLRRRIMRSIRSGPRTGGRLTQKGAIALIHLDEISRRSGIEIDRRLLVSGLHRGELTFSDDSELEIVSGELSREVRETALGASRRHGFAPYADFFAADVVTGSASPSPLDVDLLTPEDDERVVGLALNAPARHLRTLSEAALDSSPGAGS